MGNKMDVCLFYNMTLVSLNLTVAITLVILTHAFGNRRTGTGAPPLNPLRDLILSATGRIILAHGR